MKVLSIISSCNLNTTLDMVRGGMKGGSYVFWQLEAAFPFSYKALAAAEPVLILLLLALQHTTSDDMHILEAQF